jgi:branched-chain amino acid transport system substrate-binding protein
MRALVLVVAALALVLSPLRVTAQSPAPYSMDAILSLTGVAAFLGQSEEKSLQIEIATINKMGGIKGQPIVLDVLDDQSNPQVSVQLASQVIARKTPALLGPGFTATCLADAPLIMTNGPASWCFSSAFYPQQGGYMFSAGPSSYDGMIVLTRFFREKGWTRIAMITANDATGQATDKGEENALSLPENRSMKLVAREHYNSNDVTVSAQLSRIKATDPQAVIAWGNGGQFGLLTLGLRDAGMTLPVGACTCAMVYSLLAQYKGQLPAEMYFPGFSSMAAKSVAQGPIRDAQSVYFKAFKAAGVRPDLATNLPWDATMIFVEALRKFGVNAKASQIADYVRNLHSWVGINGVYDFRDGSQRGIGQNAYVIDRWDPGSDDFVAASRSGGYLREDP